MIRPEHDDKIDGDHDQDAHDFVPLVVREGWRSLQCHANVGWGVAGKWNGSEGSEALFTLTHKDHEVKLDQSRGNMDLKLRIRKILYFYPIFGSYFAIVFFSFVIFLDLYEN